MAEDREPISVTANTNFLPALVPKAHSDKSGVGRLATWPLIGFMVGFIQQPRVYVADEYVAMSTAIAVLFAFVGFLAAIVCSRWLGVTKTAMPYSQGQKTAAVFNIAMIAIVAMKVLTACEIATQTSRHELALMIFPPFGAELGLRQCRKPSHLIRKGDHQLASR